MLISQLERLVTANRNALIENKENRVVNTETYFQRNMSVVEASDELLAFHINGSEGTKDTINKARQRGMPVKVIEYTLT